MMWTTTGNLTNVKNNAKFEFGVAMLPAGKRRGSPTGGGNFYIFKKSTPAQQAAALKFIKWITSPQRAAQWGIDTGYVAVRPDAWETPVMKQYVAGFAAAAVARDQLPYAVAELSTHDNQRVTKALNDGLQAALTGTKTPEQAMKDAQREADRILRPVSALASGETRGLDVVMTHAWRVHVIGWLLLLPAAVLLVAFTHYPVAATIYTSLFSTPKAGRPGVWVGLDNYQAMVEDPVFWQALGNNLWFALGTIPVSIALALLMAVWVNGRIAGRGLLRLAFFTPTVLPMIAVANIWLFFYTPDYGLLEQITGLLGLPSHNWLGSRETALGCLMVVTVWKEAGFFMIFYLAALQSISPNLGEAAAIDGRERAGTSSAA